MVRVDVAAARSLAIAGAQPIGGPAKKLPTAPNFLGQTPSTCRHDFYGPHCSHHTLFPAPSSLQGGSAIMQAGTSLMRALRTEAPGLTRRFFGCQCRAQLHPLRDTARSSFRRHASSQLSPRNTRVTLQSKFIANIRVVRRDFSQTARANQGQSETKSFFPTENSNAVAYWLLGSAASVFGIVIFGGLTRLTESG